MKADAGIVSLFIGREREPGPVWGFEISKFIPSDALFNKTIPTCIRPYFQTFLIFSNHIIPQLFSTQMYESMEAIITQTNTGEFLSICC